MTRSIRNRPELQRRMPYLRVLKFTRPIQRPSTQLALAMLLRQDEGTALRFDGAGRITAVYSGRDYSSDIAYVVGKFESSNPVNNGYDIRRL